jgi:alanyl-tRNA synthetase
MITGMLGSQPTEHSEFNIGNFIKEFLAEFGGKGGGRKDYGQGFFPKSELSVPEIMDKLETKLFKS